jgi:hypothetical protein
MMAEKNRPKLTDRFRRNHDSGSQANETVDGLDAETEALRHAVEDTPSAAAPDDEEKVPVFDRADLAPKI